MHPIQLCRDSQKYDNVKVEFSYTLLARLELDVFPALKKFHHLKGVTFEHYSATDAKLEALAGVGLANLHWIMMECPNITCEGLKVLGRIHSLTNVHMRGCSTTGYPLDCDLNMDCVIESLSQIGSLREIGFWHATITDQALEPIATKMQLSHVQLWKCTNITLNAMVKLVQNERLKRFDFSCDKLAESEVARILESARNVTECWIDYPNASARTPAITALARRKGIKLVFEGVTFATTAGWERSGRQPMSASGWETR